MPHRVDRLDFDAVVRDRANIWSRLRSISAARDLESLTAIVREFAAASGFQNFGFALKQEPAVVGTPSFQTMLEFPAEWERRYRVLSTTPANSSDPVIRHVRTALSPTAWSCRGQVTFTAPAIARSARSLLGAAGEHGLRAGLTIPLSAPGVAWSFLVMTTRDTSDANELLPELPCSYLFAQSIMVALRRLSPGAHDSAVALSPGESEVTRWSAVGKTSWETSVILGISEHTVNFRLQSAARKLGVHGRAAAVARALSLGLIAL